MNKEFLTNRDLTAIGYGSVQLSVLRKFAGFPEPEKAGEFMQSRPKHDARKIQRWLAGIARLKEELAAPD